MSTESLGQSDEEFMAQDATQFLTDEAPAEEVIDSPDTSVEEVEEEVDQTTDSDSEAQETVETEVSDEEVGQPEGDTPEELETKTDSDDSETLDTSDVDEADTNGDTRETEKFDYESAYKKVSKPFKANGVEMSVKDPDDVVRLMQMGANYNKKMAEMKPNLKMIKMLENNGLLDEAKLHNLIDLHKKDPKAIAKLVAESGIDPLDIDTEGSKDYQATNHSVTDKEFNLNQVLEDIKGSETFDKTINVLTTDWDETSKSIVSDNPEIIRIIDGHMANGVFDKVNTVMQQEKSLGKLDGVSDVDAYKQVADQLYQSGVLRQLDGPEEPATVSSETETKSKADEERERKRKAVAPVKQSGSKAKPTTDFLGLSDEAFMKQHQSG